GARLIKAKWGAEEQVEFLAAVQIVGQDRFGMLKDIVKTISVQQRIDVRSFTIDTADGMFEAVVKLYVGSLAELQALLKQLIEIRGVFSATRSEGDTTPSA
ncbi:MAG: ACT domain-containing protein, partial [Bacteroidia bacterium]|nr:ACT domain-containing protein [Bacteroidia bacterium]